MFAIVISSRSDLFLYPENVRFSGFPASKERHADGSVAIMGNVRFAPKAVIAKCTLNPTT
jgi:hypothetical protein